MQNTITRKFARAGVIAALYVSLSLLVLPVASGAIQFRVSEALCVLPLIYAEAIPALAVGCIISNLITGCAAYDVIFGSIITLAAAAATYGIGKTPFGKFFKISVGGLFPVFLNAFLLPVIWYFCYGELEYVYMLQVLFLIISQSAAVYFIGSLCYLSLFKMRQKGVLFLQ